MRAFLILISLIGTAFHSHASEITEKITYFPETKLLQEVKRFEGSKLIELMSYSLEQKIAFHEKYAYPKDNQKLVTTVSPYQPCEGQIVGQSLFSTESDSEVLLKKWNYDKGDCRLLYVDYFSPENSQIILKKETYTTEQRLQEVTTFTWDSAGENVTSFRTVDTHGRLIKSYQPYKKFDLNFVYANYPEAERARRISLHNKSDRLLIGVIDSGFDYGHTELAFKFWNNPKESFDGRDDDGNHWIDDVFGWDQTSQTGLPSESGSSLAKDRLPMSHGTHVAHIATRDLDEVAIFGFAGDFTNVEYINQISTFLRSHPVRVINMSFSLPLDKGGDMGLRKSAKALEKMIQENPQVLFVVASGNDGKNIVEYKNRQFPASFHYENLITVGALDDLTLGLKRASYSNFGEGTVEIYAPGTKISAASIGGGLISHTGTSMAAPYVVHVAAEALLLKPELQPAQLKALILESAQQVSDEVLGSIKAVDVEALKRKLK
ncbi:S8 family serine peptidase [Bdellovibrio svalbardensis]|uniref:S8 family serine peptidase n=1 Tax=Bdellovibrio svalbardensis TaxID=2972972 RepID=A0ABT6DEP8_9BACT|nr:S8 family serine peptidase [Bdellovibrio svalbardensis]MDG0815004.1 S8 family serine peptidase [Bdellovibrio svalbardensis]